MTLLQTGDLSDRENAGQIAGQAISQDDRLANADRCLMDLWRHSRIDAVATVAACDRALEALQDLLPPPDFHNAAPFWKASRAECELWAQFASDGQIAAMLTACMDRIGGTQVAQRDREALLVAVYNSLPPDRQKAFREKVAGQ